MKIKYKKWKGTVTKVGVYGNGRIALELIDDNDGECILIITVNLVNEELTGNEIAIKNCSENEGIYQILFDAGIVGEIKRYAQSGYNKYPICDLLMNFE